MLRHDVGPFHGGSSPLGTKQQHKAMILEVGMGMEWANASLEVHYVKDDMQCAY